MMRNVYQYEAQQLSMVLWALATTNHLSSPAAVSAAAVSVETILPNLKPQVNIALHVSNTCHACECTVVCIILLH